jgi:lysophospholipase L1-like esterase
MHWRTCIVMGPSLAALVACGSSSTGSGAGGESSSGGSGSSGAPGGSSGPTSGSGSGGSSGGSSGGTTGSSSGTPAGEEEGGPARDDSGAAPAGEGGTAGTEGGSPGSKPLCVTKGTQGAFIGDSYITGAASPALQPTLDPMLMMNGAVNGYINKAVAGTAMGSGGIGLIPPQFDQALLTSSDIRLVILDGGGNDILLPAAGSPDCKNMMGNSMNAGCQAIVSKAFAAAKTLMMHMASSGVHDVIYFFYPHIPPGAGLSGSNPNEILDYAYPMAQSLCDAAASDTSGKLTCHFIDLRQPFASMGGYSNIGPDNVHPTQSGQTIIATQIWNTMKSACLGQPVSSGCCTP